MRQAQVDEVCVVVPVYNEASALPDVLAELKTVFPHVVCVDDGSADGSASIAREAGATVLRHPLNLGAGAATQTGIQHALRSAAVKHVITFDADGQHRVDDAVAMWRAARDEELDIVFGTRFADAGCTMPRGRRLLLRLATWYTRATTGLQVTDTHVGLRVLSRPAAEGLHIRLAGMAHASEMLSYVAREGLRYRELPVNVRYTTYSLTKGQPNVNAVNIAVDLLLSRVYSLP